MAKERVKIKCSVEMLFRYYEKKFFWIYCAGLLFINCGERKSLPSTITIKKLAFEMMTYPYKEKRFEYKGNKVVYIDEGIGDPVVFLHGQASDLLNFEPIYPLFEKSYRVIAMDYPGFGKSDKPKIQFSEDYLVDLVDELFTVTGLSTATLVGHSYGGYIAMLYSVAHPERVRSNVLISTAGIQEFTPMMQSIFRKSFTVDAIINTSPNKAIQNYRDSSVNWTNDMERYAHRRVGLLNNGGEEYSLYGHAMVQAMELMLNTTIREQIGILNIPTLILWGKDDPLIPYKYARETVKYIPHGKLVTIEECGHFPMLEYPEKFYGFLHEFLQELP